MGPDALWRGGPQPVGEGAGDTEQGDDEDGRAIAGRRQVAVECAAEQRADEAAGDGDGDAPISASGSRSAVHGYGIAIWDQPHSAAKPRFRSPGPRPLRGPTAGERARAPPSSTHAASAR